jgi:hypothetical protein
LEALSLGQNNGNVEHLDDFDFLLEGLTDDMVA